MKVHENSEQLFSSCASEKTANPFIRQHPFVARAAANASTTPPPWLNDSASLSQLFPRIVKNIDGTLANVEGAQGALLKYLNGISLTALPISTLHVARAPDSSFPLYRLPYL